jgi:hypothetical protein
MFFPNQGMNLSPTFDVQQLHLFWTCQFFSKLKAQPSLA